MSWGCANNNSNNSASGFNFGTGTSNNNSNNFSWSWGTPVHADLPWNYQGPFTTTVFKETVVPNKIDREYLCFGYGRKYCNQSIPLDILKECLNMFGFDGFSTKIDCKHLMTSNYYQSKIFCCNQIKFQFIIKPEERQQGSGWSFGPNRDYHLYLKLMHPSHLMKHKTAKIVAFCNINCPELNIKCQSVINTSFKVFEQGSAIMELDKAAGFMKHSLDTLESIQFYGNLDVLHIYTLNIADNILNIYKKNIKINKRINHKWELNPALSPLIKTYVSPSFDQNENFNLKLSLPMEDIRRYPACELRLQLLSLPPDVESVLIVWRCLVQCNNMSYTNAKMRQMKLNTSSSSMFFGWDNQRFNVTETDILPSILVVSCVEIIHCVKHDYITEISNARNDTNNNSNSGFSWGGSGSNWIVNSIPNEKLYAYGITKHKSCSSNEKRLRLHKQIFNVKRFDGATASGWGTGRSNFSFGGGTSSKKLFMHLIDNNDTNVDINEDIKQEESGTDFEDDFIENTAENINKEIGSEQTAKKRKDKLPNIEKRIVNKQNKIHEDIEGYEWIAKELRRISPKHCKNILNKFKEHEVTDEQLIDLDPNDWKELIYQIGIRNQMKNAFKAKLHI